MAEISLESFAAEARRLLTALDPARGKGIHEQISLVHGVFQPMKSTAKVWKASCSLAAFEAETPSGAMRGLLRELQRQLDERIRDQKESLAKLQEARRGGLKLVEPTEN